MAKAKDHKLLYYLAVADKRPCQPEGQLVITLCSVAGMLCPTGLPPFSANWA